MKNQLVTLVFAGLFVSPAYADPPAHARGQDLPPGLQKKMERGGKLPPGWERKLRRGSVLDPQVYEMSHPVEPSVGVHLPLGPRGTLDVQVEGKVIRIYAATHVIQAVFDIRRR